MESIKHGVVKIEEWSGEEKEMEIQKSEVRFKQLLNQPPKLKFPTQTPTPTEQNH